MFKKLNPLLHSELRLAVMSILIGVESADFTFIREQTDSTPGNLSVQIDKLATAGYITVEKTFRGKMPRTVCRITPRGHAAFADYVETISEYLKLLDPKPEPESEPLKPSYSPKIVFRP
jgi:DNA-binding PadR family transcriptional regulator